MVLYYFIVLTSPFLLVGTSGKDADIYFFFFKYCLAAPWPPWGPFQGNSFTNVTLITVFLIFVLSWWSPGALLHSWVPEVDQVSGGFSTRILHMQLQQLSLRAPSTQSVSLYLVSCVICSPRGIADESSNPPLVYQKLL